MNAYLQKFLGLLGVVSLMLVCQEVEAQEVEAQEADSIGSESSVEVELLTVDYASLERFVEEHPEEFDDLVARFVAIDTTLTLNDIATVYYGHSCTSSYSPYGHNDELDEALKAEDLQSVLSACEKVLQKNPVSLKALFYAAMASDNLGQPMASVYVARLTALLGAIQSSGRGLVSDEPVKVICVDDEYMFVRLVVGGRVVRQEFDGRCDLLTVVGAQAEDVDAEMEAGRYLLIYFDISRATSHLRSLFGDE